MNCDQVAKLIPWYANGSLENDEKKDVEEHLKTCSKCQEELLQASWLLKGVKKYGDVLLTGHIDSEKLVLYADSPKDLRRSERSLIKSHLKSCSECSRELDMLRESRREMERLISYKREISFGAQVMNWLRSTWGGLYWLVRQPAFAYVLILLLIYPAYLGLFRSKLETRGLPGALPRARDTVLVYSGFPHQAVLTERELTLSGQIRGIGYKVPEVYLDTTTSILHLKISYPIDTTFYFAYEAKITDSTGSIVWTHSDWRNYEIKGEERYWIFELNPAALPVGLLEVQIREHEPNEVVQAPAAIYQFRLIKNK